MRTLTVGIVLLFLSWSFFQPERYIAGPNRPAHRYQGGAAGRFSKFFCYVYDKGWHHLFRRCGLWGALIPGTWPFELLASHGLKAPVGHTKGALYAF